MQKEMRRVGFEPTHPKILEPKSNALTTRPTSPLIQPIKRGNYIYSLVRHIKFDNFSTFVFCKL